MNDLELINNAKHLQEVYVSEYRRRYKTEPLLDPCGRDFTVFKDLIKRVGLDSGKDLVITYLGMSTKWFLDKGHSLITLQGNLNVVNTELAKKKPALEDSRGPRISCSIPCDKCFSYFVKTCFANEFDNVAFCDKCQDYGTSWIDKIQPYKKELTTSDACETNLTYEHLERIAIIEEGRIKK